MKDILELIDAPFYFRVKMAIKKVFPFNTRSNLHIDVFLGQHEMRNLKIGVKIDKIFIISSVSQE